jgi:hypothetical protein
MAIIGIIRTRRIFENHFSKFDFVVVFIKNSWKIQKIKRCYLHNIKSLHYNVAL